MSKDISYKILLFIFIGNFFYEENHLFLYKRIIYSIFIYLATYEIIKFNSTSVNKSLIKMPSNYYTYITIFIVFIVVNLFQDLLNPGLNPVTLINNPQALLSVTPVFIFAVGANSQDLDKIYNLFGAICIIFLLSWVIQIPGRVPFYQGFIASHAIIPFFIISITCEKYRLPAIILILVAIAFSMVSGYRIVLLNVLCFFCFFFSLRAVKNQWFTKIIIILIGCGCVFLMLNNLGGLLAFFKGLIGKKDFEAADTRSFLYSELFGDFKWNELFLGRGFLGTYFSDYFLQLMRNADDSGDFYQRFGTEVGFLQLVLKGGFIYYILYTIPLWYVAIKSIFRYPHVKISFYIGIYILTELLLMFFENIPYFSFQFASLFFLAGFAYRGMYINKLVTENFVLEPA